MEQMLRLLGIPAVQKHVYGRTEKPPLDRGENVYYEDGTGGKPLGKGPQVRKCKVHGDEKLMMNFGSPQNYSLNVGEGTVEVNGKLFAGLVAEIGEAKPGLSATRSPAQARGRRGADGRAEGEVPGVEFGSKDGLRAVGGEIGPG